MAKPKPQISSWQDKVYHLGRDHHEQTLSAALKTLSGASWGQVKKWIANRHVQVNGNLCLDEARRVNDGDVVKLYCQAKAKPVEARDIRVVHLDDNLIVVEKPAGITSVRHFQERKLSTRRRQLQPTLEELLPTVLAKIQKLRWPPLPPKGMNRGKRQTNQLRGISRPGHIQNAKKLPPELQVFPVHRLDRDTSGLMLFARSRVAEQKLIAMFRRHTVARRYIAYCQGVIEPQTIRSWLVRDRGDGTRGSLQGGQDQPGDASLAAVEAITHIIASEPIAAGKWSRLQCKLETGRTHQIRIHLSEAGHPICGDPIYHRLGDGRLVVDDSRAPRQALHSDLLEFTHPFSGEHLQFTMPLPGDLVDWLKSISD